MDNLYTTRQAADMLGISASRVRQLVIEYRSYAHDIGIKVGRDLFLTDQDIQLLRERPRQWGQRNEKRRQPED